MSDVPPPTRADIVEQLVHIADLAMDGVLRLDEIDHLLNLRVIAPIRSLERKVG